jgi:hypothetical protein
MCVRPFSGLTVARLVDGVFCVVWTDERQTLAASVTIENWLAWDLDELKARSRWYVID